MIPALLLLLLPVRCPAAEASLLLSSTTAQLGVPVAAIAVSPAGLKPDLEASTTDDYAILPAGRALKADSGRWPLRVVPLAVGPLTIKLFWKGGGSPAQAALEVAQPRLPKDADISDIKRPAAARPPLWPWLLALALLAAAVYAWKKFKSRAAAGPASTAPADLRAPEERALEELAALEASPLWRERRYREFYFSLTEILRGYLERRYGMPALKFTTYELLRQLRQAEAERASVALCKDLFQRADLVKFAKTVPEPEQAALELEKARRLIELSRPAAPAPAETGTPGPGSGS
ncbi:MAG: hypothetical protein KGO96_08175 [Elusimicrobia bacterium]|nr:hypothetical protein [Elusimicrobiota bacterium]MDE2237809.1 hypothetical protein [Elusimicrobiota bacterium]MDE2425865.1 hypothetical protein [Elusimicrobiota bacterium]